ncbi:MAG: ATP synthase F1 subunit delta [Propionibacteriaceae bacterium]|jgi:F-type H+-transporting ATPase subunit delta|nr:ATP synthase F1 subunit delta [Propionibacteriaceae bacterium]
MTKAKSGSTNVQVTHDLNLALRTLQDHPALARALTDPSAPVQARAKLIDGAFTGISVDARAILKQALDKTWDSTKGFLAWVESTAVKTAWEWAQQTGVLERSIDEVFSFGQMMYHNHEVRAAVTDRRVSVEKRQNLVKTLLSKTMAEPSVEIAVAAVASKRGTIDDAVSAFTEIGADLAGGRLAVVTIAKPLDSKQKTKLVAALESKLGTKIIVQEVVDPAVLGGVRVECGAEVIDSTMTSRLEVARRNFA